MTYSTNLLPLSVKFSFLSRLCIYCTTSEPPGLPSFTHFNTVLKSCPVQEYFKYNKQTRILQYLLGKSFSLGLILTIVFFIFKIPSLHWALLIPLCTIDTLDVRLMQQDSLHHVHLREVGIFIAVVVTIKLFHTTITINYVRGWYTYWSMKWHTQDNTRHSDLPHWIHLNQSFSFLLVPSSCSLFQWHQEREDHS